MKKNFILLIIMAVIMITLYLPSIIFQSFETSFNLFVFAVFPSLFLMMILADIIINYKLADNVLPVIEGITKPFKISGYSSLIFFLSIFTGTPGNAKMISSALNQQFISTKEAEKLILITNFFNPLFVINTIGYKFFSNQAIGIWLFTSMFFLNFLIALFYKSGEQVALPKNHQSIGINQIITHVFKTLFIIFTIIFVCTYAINLLDYFGINKYLLSVIELTNGMYFLGNNCDIKKIILGLILINNGSLSIILQNILILKSTTINLKPYFIVKISQIILFMLILLMLNYQV